MANKKIANATPTEYNGIKFKSLIESRIYRSLLTAGITPEYEKYTYILSPKAKTTVPFYNRTPKKGFHLINRNVSAITYTPDFTFTLNGVFVIIEVKGRENDVFPFKRNLFRKLLETFDFPVMFFEVRSKKELLQSLDVIKKYTNLSKSPKRYRNGVSKPKRNKLAGR